MNVAAQYQKLAKNSPPMDVFVDRVEDRPFGCSYLFNGFMYCQIVERDGLFWDVQDTCTLDVEEWSDGYLSFKTLEELIASQVKRLDWDL